MPADRAGRHTDLIITAKALLQDIGGLISLEDSNSFQGKTRFKRIYPPGKKTKERKDEICLEN
jgi:hypothetical protein